MIFLVLNLILIVEFGRTTGMFFPRMNQYFIQNSLSGIIRFIDYM